VVLRDVPGEPRLVCADSVGMVRPEDVGAIVVAASHAALPGGRPDSIVPPGIGAVFFSDAGVGLDGAGIARMRSARNRMRGRRVGSVSRFQSARFHRLWNSFQASWKAMKVLPVPVARVSRMRS
jgi:hypothetical protein